MPENVEIHFCNHVSAVQKKGYIRHKHFQVKNLLARHKRSMAKNWGFLYKAICADPNINIDLARLISAISIEHPIKIEVLFLYISEYFSSS